MPTPKRMRLASASYRECVVGLVDILGVSQRLSDAETASRFAQSVGAILRPMIADKGEWCLLLPHVDEPRNVEVFLSPGSGHGARITFISDSIVVSVPTNPPEQGDSKCAAILSCLETVQALQRSLLMLGLRSRGGISVGGLVHAGELLVGDGLLKAYKIERNVSYFPRTVVDSAIISHLLATADEHFAVYLNRLAHALQQDEDGCFFVDYLTFSPMDGYAHLETEFPAIIQSLAQEIEAQPDRPWTPKLEWLLRYASASHEESKDPRIDSFGHAGVAFARVFPRTDETIVSFLKSEIELIQTLRHFEAPHQAGSSTGPPRWPLGWRGVLETDKKEKIEAELRKEVTLGHVLHGRPGTVLGRYHFSDDYLFHVGGGEVAQVHLTWALETKPDWPLARVYPSFAAWYSEWARRH